MRGAWDQRSRTVLIDEGLTLEEFSETLAHELVHVERGDEGRQAEEVEQLVEAIAKSEDPVTLWRGPRLCPRRASRGPQR